MKKYRLRRHNCIRETDSEERRDALFRKGYILENTKLQKENAERKKKTVPKEKGDSGQVQQGLKDA